MYKYKNICINIENRIDAKILLYIMKTYKNIITFDIFLIIP